MFTPYNLILDFDGTMTRLAINWSELRSELNLSSLNDFWDSSDRYSLLARLQKFELDGIRDTMIIDFDVISRSENWAVLTNNCESTVKSFLSRVPMQIQSSIKKPNVILGRETLNGAKENFQIFQDAIKKILLNFDDGIPTFYVGDSDYEIDYAEKIGLSAIHISNL